jgi:hypothetical protein
MKPHPCDSSLSPVLETITLPNPLWEEAPAGVRMIVRQRATFFQT